MIKRSDGLKAIADLMKDTPCAVSVAAVYLEWDAIRPGDGNFPLKTLGSGSSVGLGLALSLPHRRIAVLDGDGAVLMNVNGLVTVGRMQPKNLIHIVFDNKMYESSGRIPTSTAYNVDLVQVALSVGIKSAHHADTVAKFKSLVERGFEIDGPHFIVATVEPTETDTSTNYPQFEEPDKKYRFFRWLEALEGRKFREDAIDVKRSLRFGDTVPR